VEYAEKQKSFLFKILCVSYFIVFLVVLSPQIAYYVMMEVPYIKNHIVVALPMSNNHAFVVNHI
jgi:hypothetical protein